MSIDMPAVLIALSVLTGVLVLLFLIYLFVLVRPSGKRPDTAGLLTDYAHRGLHNDAIPENSMAAFEAACRAGYGIELDVQLSRDGVVMVFHDYTLVRMTGVEKKLCELDAAELKTLRLKESDQTIPTFAEVLALVDGRVPLLVELKGESADTSLCPKVAELLRGYRGRYCIESFNPILVGKMRKLLPNALCGLLYTNLVREKKKASGLNIILTCMALNCLAKPHFIAYNQHDRSSLALRLATGFWKAPRFVWTVRSQRDLDLAHARGDSPIFERIE